VECENQYEELMTKASNEAIETYDFKIDILCMITSHRNDEDGQWSTVVMKIEENGGVSFQSIEEEQKLNYVLKGYKATLRHKRNQG